MRAVIPKQNSIFHFRVPLYDFGPSPPEEVPLYAALPELCPDPLIEFELYGNQFCFRSADRASRKFKPKNTIEL